jgi:hypothetical protein
MGREEGTLQYGDYGVTQRYESKRIHQCIGSYPRMHLDENGPGTRRNFNSESRRKYQKRNACTSQV